MAPALYWFRQDLRLDDQPALAELAKRNHPVVLVYAWAPGDEGEWPMGAAQKVALHAALLDLSTQLTAIGSQLTLLHVKPGHTVADALVRLARATAVETIHYTPRYDPAGRAQEEALALALRSRSVQLVPAGCPTLHTPWATRKSDGTPYRVFTPFYKNLQTLPPPATPVPAPRRLAAPATWPAGVSIDQLGLLPKKDWSADMEASGPFTSAAGQAALKTFLNARLSAYATARDLPAERGTSRLSPLLALGQMSVRRVWHATHPQGTSAEPFLRQLAWRDFAQHLLYHFPHTPTRPLDSNFADFPWRWPMQAADRPNLPPDAGADTDASAWQRGQTGYPLIDAGLRELWTTGWMHNRVRMVVGSFLVKHLRLHWLVGARWFWDTLVDADLANNTFGWQWVAGCGADAAPYFRVFNPLTQSKRFDPEGTYLRRWLPELAALPIAHLHAPWEAPQPVLKAAGVRLGVTYPRPIIGCDEGRNLAMKAYAKMRGR